VMFDIRATSAMVQVTVSSSRLGPFPARRPPWRRRCGEVRRTLVRRPPGRHPPAGLSGLL